MALDRAGILAYLVGRYGQLAALSGRPQTDTPEGLGPAIDAGLLGVGVPYAELPTGVCPDGQEQLCLALAARAALGLYATDLATQVDYSVDGISQRSGSYLANVQKLIEEADQYLVSLGYGGGAYEMGSVLLDFLEPPKGEF